MNDTRKDYVESEHHAQDQFDKAVLTLSGGAFGVSFAFMNDVVGDDPHYLLWILLAWSAWGLSITLILITFYTSNEAFRRAIRNLDEGKENGGVWSTATSWLNFFAGTLFVLGVLFLVLFVALNLT